MMNRRLALFALMAVLALPFMLAGCGGDSAPNPPLYPMTVTYSVTMTNGSAAETHMFITGEAFDASNKLAPAARRTKNISFVFNGPSETANIVVRAGRNGTVLATRTIQVSPTSPILYQAVFNGADIVVP